MTPMNVGDRYPLHLKFAPKMAHPFEKRRLRPIFVYNVSVRDSEQGQLSLIESQSRTFQRAADRVGTLPLTPPKVAQKRICCFCE